MDEATSLHATAVSSNAGGSVTLDRQTLDVFTCGLRGTVCLPSDPKFDEIRKLFNAIHDKRPGLIVQCLGVSDVMKCVNLAREYDLLVSVRGGGHHMSGFASCDGGIMIDLSRMKSVRIDLKKHTARAEPGCTLFDLDTECQAFGMAVPSGVVSNTGIAGLSLGGGLGWLMRSCGLTIDDILEFDVITADGQLRKANAETHPDLYWALRGGGGNFGVVTSFEYRLHPVNSVTAGWINYPIECAREVFGFCREFIVGCSDRLVADGGFWILPGGAKSCAVAVCYNGPADEAAKAVRPLREFGVRPTRDDVRPIHPDPTSIAVRERSSSAKCCAASPSSSITAGFSAYLRHTGRAAHGIRVAAVVEAGRASFAGQGWPLYWRGCWRGRHFRNFDSLPAQ